MNILSNAFKFTPAGGRIRITLYPHRLTMSDISHQGQRHRAYRRISWKPSSSASTRVLTTSNDRNVGTGIGLDLTRSLVELHYGTISARNNEGDEGEAS